MKKTIFLLFIIFFSNSIHSQSKIISSEKIFFLKEKYKWENDEILLINFFFPQENCFYNQYENLHKSLDWFENNIYSKIDLNQIKKINVFTDKFIAKNIIDNSTSFEDFNDFFKNDLLKDFQNCHAIIAINKKGYFEFKVGEYSEKDVKTIITKLKKL